MEVKLKLLGNVKTIVFPDVVAPVGVVNLMVWLELAEACTRLMVSESVLSEAAKAADGVRKGSSSERALKLAKTTR